MMCDVLSSDDLTERVGALHGWSVEDGKLVKTYHLENWLAALGQLRAA